MKTWITIGGLLAILTTCPAFGQGTSAPPTPVCELGAYVCPSHPEFRATWPARCPTCQAVLSKAETPAVAPTLVADEDGRGDEGSRERQQRDQTGDTRRDWRLRQRYPDYYGYTYPYGYRGYSDRYNYPYRGYSYGYPPRGYYRYPDRGYSYRYPNYGYYPNYRYYDYGFGNPDPYDRYWYYARGTTTIRMSAGTPIVIAGSAENVNPPATGARPGTGAAEAMRVTDMTQDVTIKHT
jgi:hypothetical protein